MSLSPTIIFLQLQWQITMVYLKRAEVLNKFKFIMVIGPKGVQFGLLSYKSVTKSDNRETGVRFVNHAYDYRQNWTTRSPVTN